MPLLPVSMPFEIMAGAAGREAAPEQAARVADSSRANTRLVFFMIISVGFGVLHLDIRKSDRQYSGAGKIYPPTAPSRHSEVTSAARAACSGSLRSLALGCCGRVSMRPSTRSPAAAIQP